MIFQLLLALRRNPLLPNTAVLGMLRDKAAQRP